MQARKAKGPSWYLDLGLLSAYWGTGRIYHHTAPVSMIYALHEALALIYEEGLEARLKRHQKNAAALTAGLEAMGMVMHAQAGHRLNSLNSVRIPAGVDDLRVRQKLLNEYNLEIGGGLGPLKGKIWRIGLMGESSSESNVLYSAVCAGKNTGGRTLRSGSGRRVSTPPSPSLRNPEIEN